MKKILIGLLVLVTCLITNSVNAQQYYIQKPPFQIAGWYGEGCDSVVEVTTHNPSYLIWMKYYLNKSNSPKSATFVGEGYFSLKNFFDMVKQQEEDFQQGRNRGPIQSKLYEYGTGLLEEYHNCEFN